MYTSDEQKKAGRAALAYLAVSLLCALAGAIYERFSYGVYSYFMIYAFAIPLAGGALPFLAMAVFGKPRFPVRASRMAYHAGIATLTVGSLVQGILEIYGTANRLTFVYWIAGAALLAVGVALYAAKPKMAESGKQ